MASVSASHLIIFIASMMIAASVAGVFTNSVGRLSGAISEQGADVSSDIRTDIQIISSSGSTVYNDPSTTITLYIKNTGSEELEAVPEQLDVFVNGTFVTDYTVTLEPNGGQSWDSGDVVRLDINTSLSNGDHRVKVIANGDEAVFEFNVRV